MNWAVIILLGVLIVLCNATMDEIRFHWERCFGKIFPQGSKGEKWFNPTISWENKYYKSKFLTFLMSTVFVWFTDFWHLLKGILINSAFVIFLILIEEPWFLWKWVIMLIVLNIVWGILFELFLGIYGAIGDCFKEE